MKSDHFLIACRYVPYDKWFLTNINPSWKIKHVKQKIIAKALDLPFDRRVLAQNSSPIPSPITFAPIDDPFRGSSPSADKNYDVPVTQVDSKVRTREIEAGNMVTDSGNLPNSDWQSQGPIGFIERSESEDKNQIYDGVFTLVRFSTGQILEESYFVSWYSLTPHELVELHCSSPPLTFGHSLVLGQMLINRGSITVNLRNTFAGEADLDAHTSSSGIESKTATLALTVTSSPQLSSLPRHDLASYIEPYWEGWVRVLCVLQPDKSPSPAPAENTLDLKRGWISDNGRISRTKEWRERWAVIRNGVLSLCKHHNDPTRKMFPLSALVSLGGAEYFSFGRSDDDHVAANFHGSSLGIGDHNRSASSHSNLARRYRSSSLSIPSQVTTPIELDSVGAKKFLLTATVSNTPTSPRVLSSLKTFTNPDVIPMAQQLLAAPINNNHDYSNTLVPPEMVRLRRERAAIRELEREKTQNSMAKKNRPENLMRWDDFSLGFGKNRSKGKEKARGKGQKIQESDTKIYGSLGEGIEQETDHRYGPQEKEFRPGKSYPHRRKGFFHTDDRYVPTSREEAIAKGMLIVSSKFSVVNVADLANKDNNDTGRVGLDTTPMAGKSEELEYKGTRPQENKKKRNDSWQQDIAGSVISLPPRKNSRAGLGVILGNMGNVSPSGNIFGGIFGNKDKESDIAEKQERPAMEIQGDPSDFDIRPSNEVIENSDDQLSNFPNNRTPKGINLVINTERPHPKERQKAEERFEWVVLDMGTEIAYDSFLRILHRHCLSQNQSSQPPSPSPSSLWQPEGSSEPAYPEWRRGVVFRARGVGMRESGRPLELALYDQDSQAAKFEHRNHGSSLLQGRYRNTGRRWKNDEGDHDIDGDAMVVNTDEYVMTDDSDDDSEDEMAVLWQNTRRSSEDNAQEYSPTSPVSFSEPFAFTPWHQDFNETLSNSPVLSLSEERLLRPSMSSSTLASNHTSSSMSSRSMGFGALPFHLKSSLKSFISSGEKNAYNSAVIPAQYSPESYMIRSYPRRIVSPSQTLSSPSSNESLSPYPQYLRPFSPTSAVPSHASYRQPSGSLHHSISMPNASSLRTISLSGTQKQLARDRTIISPTFFERPISNLAEVHRIETKVHNLVDPLDYDDLSTNNDDLEQPRSILTPAQIREIDTEIETSIVQGNCSQTNSAGRSEDTTKQTSSSTYSSYCYKNSEYQIKLDQDLGARQPNVLSCTDAASCDSFSTTSTSFPPNLPLDSASITARAIPRRVRPRSSLQTAMGIHLEEEEGDSRPES